MPSFLDLPLELRLEIYRSICSRSKVFPTTLACVIQQIRFESAPILVHSILIEMEPPGTFHDENAMPADTFHKAYLQYAGQNDGNDEPSRGWAFDMAKPIPSLVLQHVSQLRFRVIDPERDVLWFVEIPFAPAMERRSVTVGITEKILEGIARNDPFAVGTKQWGKKVLKTLRNDIEYGTTLSDGMLRMLTDYLREEQIQFWECYGNTKLEPDEIELCR